MKIDWFTVIAQAFNFLLLIWLMKHFLYKPILNAIEAREKLIATKLADADAKETEAKKEQNDFKQKNEEFDQNHTALLNQVAEEVKTERQRLLDEANKAADDLRNKGQEKLRSDALSLNQAISIRIQQEVFAIARKILTDLGATSLEESLIEAFNRHLKDMDDKSKNDIVKAIKTSSEPMLLRSAFQLSAKQQVLIQNALNKAFSPDIHIKFETESTLISGIDLTTNGHKIAWSIADYLSSLENGINELLKEKNRQKSKDAPDLDEVKPEKRSQ